MDASFPARLTRSTIALIVGLALLLAACSGAATPVPSASPSVAAPSPSAVASASADAAAFPLTLTDDEGTEVTLDAEPEKIVSLTPATTEILFELGVGDRIVGKVEDLALYPPEAASIPDVARFGEVDVEQIVGLEADLVIAGGNSFNPPDKIAQLRTLGVPVLVVYAPDVETVFADIALTGAAVGRPDEAARLIATMERAFADVAAATAGRPTPRVFYEISDYEGYYTAADDSFLAEMIVLAGGDPITTGSATDFQISQETLLTADPELILLGDAAYGVTAQAVAARPGWNVMTAVRNGAIKPIDDIVVTRPGPRLAEGLLLLVIAIHPDAMPT